MFQFLHGLTPALSSSTSEFPRRYDVDVLTMRTHKENDLVVVHISNPKANATLLYSHGNTTDLGVKPEYSSLCTSARMEIPKFYASSLPVFVSWFILVYLLGYFIIFKDWGKLYRAEASRCLMSLINGNPAFVLSILSILKPQNSVTQLESASPNTEFQNLVVEYIISYLLLDLLHYMFLVPSDVLFISHHVATLYVLMTCRYVFEVGAVAILGMLVLAEATTTCQNTCSLTRYCKDDSTKAAVVFNLLSPSFYAYYSVVRAFLDHFLLTR